jgi:hypothetical protein
MPFDPSALQNAATAPGFDEPPPPDVYDAALTKAEIFESKAGQDTLRLGWTVVSGRLVDHQWTHVQSLEPLKPDGSDNSGALGITARILSTLGIEIAQIKTADDLPRQLAAVRGQVYSVEVKRNGAYVNTMPQSRLSSYQPSMAGTGYGSAPEPAAQNAVYGGDGPANGGGLLTQAKPPQPEITGESDVPGAKPGEFVEQPPQKGDIDPETGEPIPF